MGLTDDYFKIQEEYQKKYGERTVVIIQKGNFYEIYEYHSSMDKNKEIASSSSSSSSQTGSGNEIDKIKVFASNQDDDYIGHSTDLSIILNIALTSVNKSKPHSMTNPFMIGFPIISYENHKNIIIANDYTIVRVDQIGSSKDGELIKRKVVEISSAGTELNAVMLDQKNTNQVVSIYIECQKPHHKYDEYKLTTGLSSIDISSGENMVCEVYSQDQNSIHAVQEIYRFLASIRPREIILNLFKFPEAEYESYKKFLYESLELEKYSIVIFHYNEINPEFLLLKYQENFLYKIFNISTDPVKKVSSNNPDQKKSITIIIKQPSVSGVKNFISDLDLDKLTYGRISYILLLQYCYEHQENIIAKLQKPLLSWTDEDKHLILTHNAICQLNLISPNITQSQNKLGNHKKNFDSLLSVVDNTNTELGKRFLKNFLVNPIIDPDRLNQIYNMTEELINNKITLDFIDQKLKEIADIEKLYRKMVSKVIKPNEFCILFRNYILITNIYIEIMKSQFFIKYQDALSIPQNNIEEFNQCLSEIYSLIDFDILEKIHILNDRMDTEESFIFPGHYPEIDNIINNIKYYSSLIESICQHLNSFLSDTRGKLIEPTTDRKKRPKKDEDINLYDLDITISTTNHKASILKSKLDLIDVSLCGNLVFHSLKSTTIITSEIIQQCCDGLENSRTLLEKQLYICYNDIILSIVTKYNFFKSVSDFISFLDYLQSNARTAIKYKYFKPVIDMSKPYSFLKITDARHPLIERIIENEYIPNDIELGLNNKGVLLYGFNSTGKTSLVEAICLNIITAQCGMFTAGLLTYRPYKKICTRLSGSYDILKGHSSFIVEISELRTILRHNGPYTLVLGDELCRGTESISGTSLTIATIQRLIETSTSFIFSTHMHHLLEIDNIKNLIDKSLKIYHLSTRYDEELSEIIFERKLKDGPGSQIYGIDVCRSVGIDSKLLDQANIIRKKITNMSSLFLNDKKSRYNAMVYVDCCSLCGSNLNLNTHHITPQSAFTEKNDKILNFNKNENFNLIVLCEPCHKKIHSENLQFQLLSTLNWTYLKLEEKL